MRIAWWASGKGAYGDVWHDTGLDDTLCRPLYYFKTEDTFNQLKPDGRLTRNSFEYYLENVPVKTVQVSLANYVVSSYGLNNKYYVLTDDFVDDQWYGIYVASSNNINAVLITKVEGSGAETGEAMNEYFDNNDFGSKICDEIIGKDNKKVKIP
jgi:hypothetical protein